MARARNLKPGFFANEDLAECSFPARLCFAGLWTLADREGRLEDRPKRIKGELFRFDSIEVVPLLDELEAHGFVERYQIDGAAFIQILMFKKHQTPHYSEKPSTIKPPPLQEMKAQHGQESGGHEDPKTPGTLPEDSEKTPGADPPSRGGRNLLNPSSLNPSSLNPESTHTSVSVSREASRAGAVCRVLKTLGMADVNPGHPDLLMLLDVGATDAEITGAAQTAIDRGRGFAYALGMLKRQREDAAKSSNGMHRGPLPRSETSSQREARERVEAAVPNLAPRREPPPMEVVDVVAKRVG